jgi:hypothetical protein
VLGLVAESLPVIRDGDDIPEAIFKVGLMLPDIDDNMFQIRKTVFKTPMLLRERTIKQERRCN